MIHTMNDFAKTDNSLHYCNLIYSLVKPYLKYPLLALLVGKLKELDRISFIKICIAFIHGEIMLKWHSYFESTSIQTAKSLNSNLFSYFSKVEDLNF